MKLDPCCLCTQVERKMKTAFESYQNYVYHFQNKGNVFNARHPDVLLMTIDIQMTVKTQHVALK